MMGATRVSSRRSSPPPNTHISSLPPSLPPAFAVPPPIPAPHQRDLLEGLVHARQGQRLGREHGALRGARARGHGPKVALGLVLALRSGRAGGGRSRLRVLGWWVCPLACLHSACARAHRRGRERVYVCARVQSSPEPRGPGRRPPAPAPPHLERGLLLAGGLGQSLPWRAAAMHSKGSGAG